uniref:hypothetical protein n=1 Tax=Bacteroides eggerthii TaxID=28111 RepID=UPI003FED71BD
MFAYTECLDTSLGIIIIKRKFRVIKECPQVSFLIDGISDRLRYWACDRQRMSIPPLLITSWGADSRILDLTFRSQ